jgi:hypothetical protein
MFEIKLTNNRVIHIVESVILTYWWEYLDHPVYPAKIYNNGSMMWHRRNQFHRIDKPAIIYPHGYKNTNLHRLNKPARINPNGLKEYWEYGRFIRQEI